MKMGNVARYKASLQVLANQLITTMATVDGVISETPSDSREFKEAQDLHGELSRRLWATKEQIKYATVHSDKVFNG